MSKEARLSPVELLRQLTLSVERLAAQGIASGAVRGATEELRAGHPELDGQLQAVFKEVLTLLERMAHEAAGRPFRPPEEWSRLVAESAVRGAVEELRRLMPGVDVLSREVVVRLNQLLERSIRVEANRETELHTVEMRARLTAAGAVRGVLGQVHDSMQELVPVAAELSSQVGAGFIEGLGAKAAEKSDALAEFLEHAGRRFVHALVDQLDTELRARWGKEEGRLGRALEGTAEQIAAACVRGATGELVHQVRSLGESIPVGGVLQRAGREVSSGILAALGEGLRKPFVVVAGAGSALLLAVLLVTKSR
ncbi:hypothetical protein [Vitiosangium sp. GDMCC 1.1324]|uniref:hypothetical protein n=1 Tax=Vitiosangium sp. (strain GDMCC 1.1324) TaxID=2138576 RepID=UPI000D3A795A|nr:hypothetical protein [Vitiosangium sp. GDMCC 1.1324]PTL82575.1 hypothetical protein DAT35_17395 [Vitiosangium sp. GDMCC 1.1324]